MSNVWANLNPSCYIAFVCKKQEIVNFMTPFLKGVQEFVNYLTPYPKGVQEIVNFMTPYPKGRGGNFGGKCVKFMYIVILKKSSSLFQGIDQDKLSM